MSDEDLIKRLRSDHPDYLTSAAADRLAALVAERDEYHAEAMAWIERWGNALKERDAAKAQVARLREALTKFRDLTCEAIEDDDGNSGCGQCQSDCTGCIAHAALAASAPQSTALDDKIGPDAVAKAARVLLDAWNADDPRVVSPWAATEDIGSVEFGELLRAIGEASHD